MQRKVTPAATDKKPVDKKPAAVKLKPTAANVAPAAPAQAAATN